MMRSLRHAPYVIRWRHYAHLFLEPRRSLWPMFKYHMPFTYSGRPLRGENIHLAVAAKSNNRVLKRPPTANTPSLVPTRNPARRPGILQMIWSITTSTPSVCQGVSNPFQRGLNKVIPGSRLGSDHNLVLTNLKVEVMGKGLLIHPGNRFDWKRCGNLQVQDWRQICYPKNRGLWCRHRGNIKEVFENKWQKKLH